MRRNDEIDRPNPRRTSGSYTINHHDMTTESLSVSVVIAFTDATDIDHLDMTPLSETVDPEALDELFVEQEGTTDRAASVSFEQDGHRVTVDSDGWITIER